MGHQGTVGVASQNWRSGSKRQTSETMHPVLAIVALALVAHESTGLQSGGSEESNPLDTLCAGKQCPQYQVIQTRSKTSDYEIRRYKPSVWVETSKKAGESKLNMIQRLFNYMKGNNSEAKTISMSLPIVGEMTSVQGNGPISTASMRFYLGSDTGTFNPPRPLDPDTHIHHDPAMTYYVKVFRTSDWRNMILWNRAALQFKGVTGVSHNEYCAAGYGPRGAGMKYNEIWIHISSNENDHHYHHHNHNSQHDHHHGDHDHQHDNEHGHDHGGDHNH